MKKQNKLSTTHSILHTPSGTNNSGITLIEVLITVALLTAMAGLGLSVGIDVYRSSSLANERNLLISSLEKARNLAVTNTGGSPHGVYIEDNKNTVFRGSSYATRDPEYDQEIPNSSLITATGTLEMVFEQLSGDGLLYGTVTLADDRGVTRDITVNSEGRIDW